VSVLIFLTQVGAEVVTSLVDAALSIIDIRYIRFEVQMDEVTKMFAFVSNTTDFFWTV
jgi:hypothetical protein